VLVRNSPCPRDDTKTPAVHLRGDPSSSIGECGTNNEDSVGKNQYTVTMTKLIHWVCFSLRSQYFLIYPKISPNFINSKFRNRLHNTPTPSPYLDLHKSSPRHVSSLRYTLIIIIIIIIITCNWVVTRWQWLFYMYTNMR